MNINSRQDLLMITLTQYFKNKGNLSKMLKIVNGESLISLRILDWFVTNYSKKHNTSYNIINSANNLKTLHVFIEYKSQLKAYSKKQFDPFCRRERISFYDTDNKEIITTVGQLNFFRWIIENKIIEYVEKNIDSIEKDMNESLKSLKKSTSDTESTKSTECGSLSPLSKTECAPLSSLSRTECAPLSRTETKDLIKHKKKQELSISATKIINNNNVQILVKFD